MNVTEAEAFEELEQFDVAEAAIGQDRERHALGQDRLQTRQAQVLEAVARSLQFVLVDRQPEERRRAAVARDHGSKPAWPDCRASKSVLGTIATTIAVALAHDIARPWREQVPYDDAAIARAGDRPVCIACLSIRPQRLRRRRSIGADQRNGQRRLGVRTPRRASGQRKNPLGVPSSPNNVRLQRNHDRLPSDRSTCACCGLSWSREDRCSRLSLRIRDD